jgi:hypothetical protein
LLQSRSQISPVTSGVGARLAVCRKALPLPGREGIGRGHRPDPVLTVCCQEAGMGAVVVAPGWVTEGMPPGTRAQPEP